MFILDKYSILVTSKAGAVADAYHYTCTYFLYIFQYSMAGLTIGRTMKQRNDWTIKQEGVEPEKTEQLGSIEPPSVGDMGQSANRRGSTRLNTFETMLDPPEIVNTLTQVRILIYEEIQ